MISQKCQYALRAMFELAKQHGRGPVKISEIAEHQAIPARFLEVILSEMKQGGFVGSRRGSEGGYLLVRPPEGVTVGAIIRFVEGPFAPVPCIEDDAAARRCALYPRCVFMPMWDKVRRAISEIYDTTTLADLVEQEALRSSQNVSQYSI